MTGLLFAAWRNFTRNIMRYRVLLVALVLITAVLLVVLGIVLGLRDGLYQKASRYFSGNIVVLGYIGDGDSLIEQPDQVIQAVQRLDEQGIQLRSYSRRSSYYDRKNIELFFSGYYINQRRMVGVEWELEEPILQEFDFFAGGVPDAGNESAILISTATAEKLNIDVGDELLVSIQSDRGRTNTAELIVGGIFSESSFFGYQVYIHRRTLNRLREVPEDEINEIGVYLEDPLRTEDAAARALAGELARTLPTFGVIQTRDEYSELSRKDHGQRSYGVVSVGAQLAEIDDLLKAMTLIAGLVILMFLCIVVVGVGNTFSMIVWERTQEIGTLRALGMQRRRAILSFLAEAGFLGLGSVVLGLFLGLGILELVHRGLSFPANLVTTLFLTRGRLQWLMPSWGLVSISLLVVGACILGSLRAALRAGSMSPVEALSHHK
ncbi:FtsX-like permease family protein [Marispirochaeta sp.]|jgi:putative ABC transport system permease protein|uniref:ABC transporter permease n=1 Tax=Marispirochaeta sp. TaxID=2038653 RepID=UPI0029C83529|nr:FtsX-like permease family protein [Marispirochaeta sp.]